MPLKARSGTCTGQDMRQCEPAAPVLHLPQASTCLQASKPHAQEHTCRQHLRSTSCRHAAIRPLKMTPQHMASPAGRPAVLPGAPSLPALRAPSLRAHACPAPAGQTSDGFAESRAKQQSSCCSLGVLTVHSEMSLLVLPALSCRCVEHRPRLLSHESAQVQHATQTYIAGASV